MDAQINELKHTLKAMRDELSSRPTMEEVEEQMAKLNGYVTIKSHEQLKSIVVNKCDWIQFDELRLKTEGIDKTVKDHAVDLERSALRSETLGDENTLTNTRLEEFKKKTEGHFKEVKDGMTVNKELGNRQLRELREKINNTAKETEKFMSNLVTKPDI